MTSTVKVCFGLAETCTELIFTLNLQNRPGEKFSIYQNRPTRSIFPIRGFIENNPLLFGPLRKIERIFKITLPLRIPPIVFPKKSSKGGVFSMKLPDIKITKDFKAEMKDNFEKKVFFFIFSKKFCVAKLRLVCSMKSNVMTKKGKQRQHKFTN